MCTETRTQNLREVKVVIEVARQLTVAGKSFRIITPYDQQRSALENGLKDAKLPWQDKCFNIDAFQGPLISPFLRCLLIAAISGNEDDYIIVSVVRSVKLGFLTDARRVNVMLTRCKKGMIICSNRTFLEGPAAHTLVGKMFAIFGDSNVVGGAQVLLGQVRPFA
jgi:regulator of nonsense transcripts 1